MDVIGLENKGVFRIAVRGVIMHKGKFLLMKRSKIARGEHGYWELPGGGLDFGEAPEEALKREVQEEVQMDVEVIKPLSVWHYVRKNNLQIIGFTYLCTTKDDTVTLSDEHLEHTWIQHDQIEAYKIFPELAQEISEWDWEEIYRVVSN